MGFVKKKGIVSVTGLLAITMIAGTVTINAQSQKKEKLSMNIPDAGIAVALKNYDNKDENKKAEISAIMKDKVKEAQPQAEQQTDAAQPETQAQTPAQTSIYDTLAMSQVEDYVNVRALPNTDAEIVGKIYNNCAATIIGTEGDWYKIKSGNVEGYINSQYFVTGEQAKAIATQCGFVNATVKTETLNVRESQNTDSRVLTQLPEGETYDVIQYGDGWVYLSVDGDIQGWVSMEFVDIDVKYNTALTLQEEQEKIAEEQKRAEEAAEAERLAKEAQAQKEAEEAKKAKEAEAARIKEQEKKSQAAANAAKNETPKASSNNNSNASKQVKEEPVQSTANVDTSSSSALRNAVVAYALQFVGNPYVYGGTSLTNGTDCSGFTMSVYAHFGYGLPHQSGSQSGCGVAVSTSSLLPGDLLFYSDGSGNGISHVALYIGNGQIVHASTPATGIKVSGAFYRTPMCAVRIIN